MPNDKAPKYKPDAVKSPGQLLKETLSDMGISHGEFRHTAGIEKDYFYRFLNGEAPLSHELAVRLEQWAKLPQWLWKRHEKRWQDYLNQKGSTQ